MKSLEYDTLVYLWYVENSVILLIFVVIGCRTYVVDALPGLSVEGREKLFNFAESIKKQIQTELLNKFIIIRIKMHLLNYWYLQFVKLTTCVWVEYLSKCFTERLSNWVFFNWYFFKNLGKVHMEQRKDFDYILLYDHPNLKELVKFYLANWLIHWHAATPNLNIHITVYVLFPLL